MVMVDGQYRFAGFSEPNYTMIPDVFFDEIAPHLSEAELRVLLYIFRRTFGFKKQADTISLKQMVEGIKTKDGRVLDHGAGVAKSTAWRGVKGLSEKGIIAVTRNASKAHGDEATTYALVFCPPVFRSETPPVSERNTPRVSQRNTQETVLQETVLQETVRQEEILSKDTNCGKLVDNSVDNPDTHRNDPPPQITAIITDFSREMNDTEHAPSNITQATRLYEQLHCTLDIYFTMLYAARARTRKATGVSNRMAYFFEVLRQDIDQRAMPAASAASRHPPSLPPLPDAQMSRMSDMGRAP